MTTVCVLLLHHKLNKTPTTVKLLHTVDILILCTSTEHVFNVSAVLSHYELHTTTPFTDALVNTEFWLLMNMIDSNISESTEKLTSEWKSLVKQQILMYKTAVYRLFNGGITHQKQQISEKGDDVAIHRLSVNVLPRNITFFRYLLFLMCNTAVK